MRAALVLALPLAMAGCLTLNSDPPEHYVEGLATDLYLTAPLPPYLDTRILGVTVLTAPLRDPVLQPAPDFTINVVAYDGFGDNYYDGSLGLTELRDPLQGRSRWTWTGPVTMPRSPLPGQPGTARFFGVQIRGLYYEAYPSAPQHEWCWISAMGLGVGDCSEWIDAILQLLVQCRGIVGEIIDCHGLTWAIVPTVLLSGAGPLQGLPMSEYYRYLMVPPLAIIHGPNGYSYSEELSRMTRRGDPPPPPSPVYGPFPDPETAARDLAARFGQKYRYHRFFPPDAGRPEMAALASDELHAFAAAVNAAMDEQDE